MGAGIANCFISNTVNLFTSDGMELLVCSMGRDVDLHLGIESTIIGRAVNDRGQAVGLTHRNAKSFQCLTALIDRPFEPLREPIQGTNHSLSIFCMPSCIIGHQLTAL